MITVEEKMALAKEVGAEGFIWYRETLKEAQELGAMKFKPTSMEEIRKRLSLWTWQGPGSQNSRSLERVIFRVAMPIALAILGSVAAFVPPTHYGAGGIIAGLGVLWFLSFGIEITDFDVRRLEEWTGNLPYGALLAVKEAKAKGISNFCIYYPRLARGQKIAADPIIAGNTPKGQMVEVFAWDDGKIYE